MKNSLRLFTCVIMFFGFLVKDNHTLNSKDEQILAEDLSIAKWANESANKNSIRRLQLSSNDDRTL